MLADYEFAAMNRFLVITMNLKDGEARERRLYFVDLDTPDDMIFYYQAVGREGKSFKNSVLKDLSCLASDILMNMSQISIHERNTLHHYHSVHLVDDSKARQITGEDRKVVIAMTNLLNRLYKKLLSHLYRNLLHQEDYLMLKTGEPCLTSDDLNDAALRVISDFCDLIERTDGHVVNRDEIPELEHDDDEKGFGSSNPELSPVQQIRLSLDDTETAISLSKEDYLREEITQPSTAMITDSVAVPRTTSRA